MSEENEAQYKEGDVQIKIDHLSKTYYTDTSQTTVLEAFHL